MLLVLCVVAAAAILCYAMLANASLRQQATANAAGTLGAQGMAESGVNLATYYLQSPERWTGYPSTYPQTEDYEREWRYWTGTGGQFVDFGTPSRGSVKVSVVRRDPAVRWGYDIESVGRAPGSSVERRVTASVLVNAEYKITSAAYFAQDVTFPSGARIGESGMNNGDAYSNGGLVIRAGGVIWGKGTRRKNTFTPASPVSGWRSPPPVVPQVLPRSLTEIRDYLTYEYPAGSSFSANVLPANTEVGETCAIKNLGATATNPAGIHYVSGNAILQKNATVNGTLIVNGNLLIDGSGVQVIARTGFPAILVNGDVIFSLPTGQCDLTVGGVCWVGGKIDSINLLPTLNVMGSLMVAGSTPLFPNAPAARVNLIYESTKTTLPDFSPIGRTPTSVAVLSWKAQ